MVTTRLVSNHQSPTTPVETSLREATPWQKAKRVAALILGGLMGASSSTVTAAGAGGDQSRSLSNRLIRYFSTGIWQTESARIVTSDPVRSYS